MSREGGRCQGHADFPYCQVSLILSREIGDPRPSLEGLVGGCQGVRGWSPLPLLQAIPNSLPPLGYFEPVISLLNLSCSTYKGVVRKIPEMGP